MISCVQRELYFLSCVVEYFLQCSEIDIASVSFFCTLGGWIDVNMNSMMLKSYLDEELDMYSFLLFLGASMVPMGGIFVIFYFYFIIFIE